MEYRGAGRRGDGLDDRREVFRGRAEDIMAGERGRTAGKVSGQNKRGQAKVME